MGPKGNEHVAKNAYLLQRRLWRAGWFDRLGAQRRIAGGNGDEFRQPPFPRRAAGRAIVGISIGGALGAVDGVQARSIRLAARGAFFGGSLGLIGGLIGLVSGELIFSYAGGGVWPRAAGWAIFGGLVGASEGIATRAPLKRTYGAIGGVLGGMVGGSAYERTSDLLRLTTQNRDFAVTAGGAVGLVIPVPV